MARGSSESVSKRCGGVIALAAVGWASLPAWGIISSNTALSINTIIGANRFYAEGLTGSRAVALNIESGHVWSGHETLRHVSTFLDNPDPVFDGSQLGQFHRHSTWVGGTIAGRALDIASTTERQRGIAYGAELWSGAVATVWVGAAYTGSFNWSRDDAFLYPFLVGSTLGVNGRRADVINTSWGSSDSAASGLIARTLDGLAANSLTTFVASAGNSGSGSNTVGAPGSGYNTIAVGATGPDTGSNPYRQITSFSSRGPSNFFNPVTGVTVNSVRATVDLVAPGQSLTLPFYGGTTGGNTGGTDTTNGATNTYSTGVNGTSFSSPIVAGAVALLHDAAYARLGRTPADALDPRVVRTVLLNSADPLSGWTNNASTVSGVWRTTQSLDWTQGAGTLNLSKAFDQLLSGTTDLAGLTPGPVLPSGWDLGQVSSAAPSDYFMPVPLAAGFQFVATLNWFVDRTFNSVSPTGTISTSDLRFADLDLQLFSADSTGAALTLLAESASTYNNVEHLRFTIPSDGNYLVRVRWNGELYDTLGGADAATYALSWRGIRAFPQVPEPASLSLLAVPAIALLRPRVRRRPAILN